MVKMKFGLFNLDKAKDSVIAWGLSLDFPVI